jgi:hypothetical protein
MRFNYAGRLQSLGRVICESCKSPMLGYGELEWPGYFFCKCQEKANPLGDRIQEAAVNYCMTDDYPTGNSGFRAGAKQFYSEAIKDVCEFIKSEWDSLQSESSVPLGPHSLSFEIERRFKEGK